MVAKFESRIEAVLQSHRFQLAAKLEPVRLWLYINRVCKFAVGGKTPLQAIKNWHQRKHELFKKQPNPFLG